MYEFHYDYIKNKYSKNKNRQLFTDTDSLMCEIKTEDVYKILVRIKVSLILVIIQPSHNIMIQTK